ncbi:DegQ family serine endoprotease [Halodesulfovibrio aestuarii]|uniref:DegQ family serine endoprotease n=1 Tax=Halodesulfovibrio aestuarii TaxID=126333 RepID=UPI0035212E34
MTFRNRLFLLPIFVLAFTLTTLPAMADLPNFTKLAKEAGPAVVNISTQKTITVPRKNQPEIPNFFENDPRSPLNDFFKQFERYFRNGRPRPETERSLGSGFIISSDGFIATNNHVVEGADEIKVNILDENGDYESYDAKVIGTDKLTDLALLKIDAKRELPTLKLADFSEVEVGQWVLAIGNPFGLDHTVTSGIVSALGRNISNNPYDNFLQTDASINPGNSGGPLLNLKGEVIAINTAIIARGQGIGFAIPSSIVKDIINKLKTDKKIRRGWLGVSITNVDPNMAQALGLDESEGAFIAQVVQGQPAAAAGLLEGDIILKVNGDKVADASELIRIVSSLTPGSTAKFTVYRKDKTITVKVKLGERDSEDQQQAPQKGSKPTNSDIKELGLTLAPLDVKTAQALGIKDIKGLLITNIAQDSVAARAELRAGDVILEANLTPVNSVKEFLNILKTQGEKRGAMLLKVVRQQQVMFRTMTLEK